MTRIIMHGCNGAMGKMISQLVKEDENAEIVAGIDIVDNKENKFPVFTNINDCDVEADVMIDFASTKAIDSLLDFCVAKKMPVVVCTTGLSEAQIEKIQETSKKTAVLKSANMSVGVNTLFKLVQAAAKVLTETGFDIEIVEKHHNQKVDAPSGTALALADAINEVMEEPFEYVYDRSPRREKRQKKELGIVSVRGGNIVGEHDVIFAGTDEVITFQHTAYSKAVFAKGSIAAAKFLARKEVGLYDMSHVIEEQ